MIVDMKKEATDISNETGKMTNEVIIYESGDPVLKVEMGTTLKVIKLLYETQQAKKCQILGVRPKGFGDGIPCIVTLNESKLHELSYDLLVSDEGTNSSSSDVTLSRCIDCSRDSWKNKKFISIGMNTELSVNPLSDLEATKLTSNETYSVSNLNDKPQTGPVTYSPPKFTSSRYNEKVSSEFDKNSNSSTDKFAENERVASLHSPPSPTYDMDTYNKRLLQARFRHAPRSSIEPLHYDHFTSSHVWTSARPHYTHTVPPYEQSSLSRSVRSPTRRSRSPISPRHIDVPAQFHNLHEKRLLMLHSHEHRGKRERRSPPQSLYDRYDDLHQAAHRDKYLMQKESDRDLPSNLMEYRRDDKLFRPLQPAEEPPVFVLPNDYDVISGLDPRVTSLHEKQMTKSQILIEKDLIKQRGEESETKHGSEEHQNQQSTSNGSSSPNSNSGSVDGQETTKNHSQKLYCKICNSVFPTKSLLYKHLRGHTSDEKPFKCTECGQGFTLSSNLRQHRIIHRGYKPFQCEFCGKKFMRSNVYKQHRRIHTGEEMHKCGLCPSEFLQKYALMKHMKKNHDIEAIDN